MNVPFRGPVAPGLHVEMGRAVPGWAVRLLPAVVVVLVALVVGAGSVAVAVVAVIGAALLTARPEWPVAPVLVGAVGVSVLAGPDLLAAGTGDPLRLMVLLAASAVVLQLAGLTAHCAWDARVEPVLLVRALASAGAVAAGAVGLAAAVLGLRTGLGAPEAEVWRSVAVAAGVGLVLLTVPRVWLRRRRRLRPLT